MSDTRTVEEISAALDLAWEKDGSPWDDARWSAIRDVAKRLEIPWGDYSPPRARKVGG